MIMTIGKEFKAERYFIPVMLFLVCTAFTQYFIDAFYGAKVVLSIILLAGLIYFYGIRGLYSGRLFVPVIIMSALGAYVLLLQGGLRFAAGNYAGLVMLLVMIKQQK